jgi:hypothetical protein
MYSHLPSISGGIFLQPLLKDMSCCGEANPHNMVTKYYQCDEVKEDEMSRACGSHSYKILGEKPERRRSLERYRHRCKYNIRMDLREKGWEVDRVHLAQNM